MGYVGYEVLFLTSKEIMGYLWTSLMYAPKRQPVSVTLNEVTFKLLQSCSLKNIETS